MKKLLTITILLFFCQSAYSQWHPMGGYVQLGPEYHYEGYLEFDLSPDNSIYVVYRYSGYSIHHTWFQMAKSIDEGSSWSIINGIQVSSTIKKIQCVAPEQLLEFHTLQMSSSIYSTSNDFKNKTLIPGTENSDGHFNAFDFIDISRGFALSSYPWELLGKVENSIYGYTFGDSVNFKYGSVKMLNDTTAYLLCRDNFANPNKSGNNMLLKTTDFGITWNTVFKDTAYKMNHFVFASENEGIMVGKQGTIIQTTDGGTSWTPMVSGTSTVINYITERNGIYFCVGDTGLILKKNANSDLWDNISYGTKNYLKIKLNTNMVGYIQTPTSILRSDEVLESKNDLVTETIIIYPNPSSGQLYYSSSNLNLLKGIKLRNSYGQEVLSISDGVNGYLDVSDLNTGIYIISFDFGEQLIVKKLVITGR